MAYLGREKIQNAHFDQVPQMRAILNLDQETEMNYATFTAQDCPKCGKKESSWDGRYCGSCEENYVREEEEAREQDIAAEQKKMQLCGCGGECGRCVRAYANILNLEGKHHEAMLVLNNH